MDTIDTIKITEADIKLFEKLSHSDVLELNNEMKMKYLYSFQVKHKKLEIIANDLMSLLSPFNETNILFLIGATGVGKTTLTKRIIRQLVDKHQSDNDPSTISLIFIPAPANGERSLSWASIYEKILRNSNEILINKKSANQIENGILSVKPRSYKSIPALRGALESMMENRKVRVLVIDEAYHMLRFGNKSAVMDTLKSIADDTGVKLLLMGSYDLFELASDYAQVSRRAEIPHFERYHIGIKNDIVEFTLIINKIQQNWPCGEVPNFCAIAKELMEATIGCIGLLKTLFLRALSMQLNNKGKWDPKFLTRAAKSMKLIASIRKETERGESNVKGATYGESLFSGQILKDAITKMSTKPCHE